ncbi:hypothetical protein J6590_073717 [Homalodisca vitripennis]|nr:hypothetical protein J6590_073717 [Homalodisca vitripennis]
MQLSHEVLVSHNQTPLDPYGRVSSGTPSSTVTVNAGSTSRRVVTRCRGSPAGPGVGPNTFYGSGNPPIGRYRLLLSSRPTPVIFFCEGTSSSDPRIARPPRYVLAGYGLNEETEKTSLQGY